MKNKLTSFCKGFASKCMAIGMFVLLLTAISYPIAIQAQIWEPEGLNMPGAWNSWNNPPTNNLALASSTQVTDGRIVKITDGTTRWQTIFSVAESGADLIEGNYNWLFTSGPAGTPWNNKWAGVNVSMNTLIGYTFNQGADNNITIVNDKWYTMVWEDSGYGNTRAIFMETSAEPVTITSVSTPEENVDPDEPVAVTVSTSQTVSPEEIVYIRYTTDNWNTSSLATVNFFGNTGSAIIPGKPEGTTVQYYAFSSTVTGIIADYDLYTIHFNNNNGDNYSYMVEGEPEEAITWANLQHPPSGIILPEDDFFVYTRVFADGITTGEGQGLGIQAWIGYSNTDTNPDTWTNWIEASYLGDVGNNDEYIANLGAMLSQTGTYYYASRFRLNEQDYVYGGYSAGGGGFWNGTDYVSGELDVTTLSQDAEITFANLQWPPQETILMEESFTVYAQVLADETPLTPEGYLGMQAWVGYNDEDSNPEGWTTWFPATYNGISGFTSRPEYTTSIGSGIDVAGTYYYATRFKLGDGNYVYGGYSQDGGGFWEANNNISGVLTVTTVPTEPEIAWANLQHPPSGSIEPASEFIVYARVFINGLTGSGASTESLEDLAAWIGYNTTDATTVSDFETGWTWVAASLNDYDPVFGNNSQYSADIGSGIEAEETYYYVSRFQYDGQDIVYGGYNGGFWDGTDNVSGLLTVEEDGPPQPEYGMRDDDGVNLPTVTYWYSGQEFDITEKGADFENKELGTIEELYIKGASVKTWKSGEGDVTGAQFLYKIWNTGDAEPAEFTLRNVGWTSDDGDGNQTWADFGDEIEITDGLVAGTYNLMILFTISGSGVPGITENGSFTANFEMPEPGIPENLNVSGLIIGDECFNASESIVIASTTIQAGAIADFRSGGTIDATDLLVDEGATAYLTASASVSMNTGVLITPGSGLFLAQIAIFEPCLLPESMLASEEIFMTGEIADNTVSKSLLQIFPNPTNGRFVIQMENVDETSAISVEIYNMMGEQIMYKQLFGSQQHELDLSYNPVGIYIIRVLYDGKIAIEKIIRQ